MFFKANTSFNTANPFWVKAFYEQQHRVTHSALWASAVPECPTAVMEATTAFGQALT